MTAAADIEPEAPPKKSKMPLILGLVLALVGGGGGFFAVSSGLILAGGESDAKHDEGHADSGDHSSEDGDKPDGPTAAFVPIEPLVISIAGTGGTRFLRFGAQLEVPPEHEAEVAAIMPRIVDVLNGYLRAVDLEELADPDVLVRLRGQMLRRVQVVTGQKQVRDLLIMEFVLN